MTDDHTTTDDPAQPHPPQPGDTPATPRNNAPTQTDPTPQTATAPEGDAVEGGVGGRAVGVDGGAGIGGRRVWRVVAGVVAWAGVAGWGAWAVMWAAGADRLPGVSTQAAPLLAVTPYVVAAAPLSIIVALVLRRRRAALAAILVTAVLAASVAPRAIGGGQPDARGPIIRVLTVNLYYGEADARQVVDLVRRTRADVLSLQELPPSAVARYERAGLADLLPHKAIDPRGRAAGSGLYSRYALTRLPDLPRTRMAMPRAELTLPGGRRVEVTAIHPIPPLGAEAAEAWRRDLDLLPGARTPTAAAATSTLASATGGGAPPVRILAGDFNATLDHASLRHILDRGYADAADRTGAGLVPTWGVEEPAPALTIDHILVDARCAVRDVSVHDVTGSDHRAVFAEVQLP